MRTKLEKHTEIVSDMEAMLKRISGVEEIRIICEDNIKRIAGDGVIFSPEVIELAQKWGTQIEMCHDLITKYWKMYFETAEKLTKN